MTVNDIAAKPVQVLVNNGTNNLDCSSIFQSFNLQSDEWSPEGWWRPTATLTLAANNPSFAATLDARLNTSRWAPDNLVSVAVDFGSGWVPIPCRLKILKWPARPYPGSQNITLQLGGDAILRSYRSPEGDAGGATFGTLASRKTLINSVLAAAGCPAIATADTFSAYSLAFSPEKKTGGSWVDFAGDLAWSANRLLWQEADGDIRVNEFSVGVLESLQPIAHYVVGIDEARYIPQAPTETPPDTFKGVGTGLSLTPASDDPESFVNTVDGVEVETTITYSGQGGNNPSRQVTIRKPRNVILPNYFTISDPATDSETTTTDTYSAVDGTLTRTVIETREPIAKVFPERTWGSALNMTDSYEKTTEYEYDSDKVIIRRTTDIRRAKYTGSVILADYQYVDERWRKRGDKWNYTRDVTNQDPDASNAPKLSTPTSSQSPPATQYRPPANTKEQTDYSAEITVSSPTGGDYAGKPQVISLPGGLCASNVQVMDVIKLWATIRHGRQWPIAWTAPLSAAWLTSFSPVQTLDFTYQGTRTRYLVEALQIWLDKRSARIGGSTIELGTVALDGTGTPNAPYTITEA